MIVSFEAGFLAQEALMSRKCLMPRTVGLLFSNKPRRGALGGDQYA
jgi:hypothetical protein